MVGNILAVWHSGAEERSMVALVILRVVWVCLQWLFCWYHTHCRQIVVKFTPLLEQWANWDWPKTYTTMLVIEAGDSNPTSSHPVSSCYGDQTGAGGSSTTSKLWARRLAGGIPARSIKAIRAIRATTKAIKTCILRAG
ncbi:hypothetical protein V8F33_007524 [Rhypophila sp. PSN 637]